MPEQSSKEQPAQPTFPTVNVLVATDGMVIETFIAPNISFKQVLPESQVNEVMKLWVQTRKQIQQQQQLISDVMRTKR